MKNADFHSNPLAPNDSHVLMPETGWLVQQQQTARDVPISAA
jgi:hypothetical protein